MRSRTTAIFVAAMLGVALAGPASPAMAVESDSGADDDIRVQIRVDGQMIDVTDRFSASDTQESLAASEPGGPSDLLDWNQYFGCFSLDHQDDVYAEYGWWWDGVLQDVRLKCGTSGWGYKHIRANHEGNWQDQLNIARANGWNTGAGAHGSWDDLMSGAAGSIVTWPDFVGGSAINKTTCGTGELFFVNSRTGAIIYSFRAIAVWANDSDRFLNAYPTNRTTC